MKVKIQYRNSIAALGLALALALPPTAAAAGPKDLERGAKFMNLVTSFLEVIESTHTVYGDPEKAAIFHLHKIQELYKKNGQPKEAAAVFTNVLENSKNKTVRNSAYIMLADVLKEAGETEEAIRILKKGLAENLEAAN